MPRKRLPGPLRCDYPDIFRPTTTPGPLGINDKSDPSPRQRYRAQLCQLHIEIGKRLRARAVSTWALVFFQRNLDIGEIAKALTAKIDDALLTVNRGIERLMAASFFFDLTNGVTGWNFRDIINKTADLYLQGSRMSWLITYRIPRAVAVQAVEDHRGMCEEHAFLAVYLLTLGHMIQNMPFGQLKGDIYYTGAATSKHAMVILVKGAEFKDVIIASKKRTGKINLEWLRTHTKEWGKSAWIADGWTGEAKKLADNSIKLHYSKNQSFRRDVMSGSTSKWDVTLSQMVERVAKAYKI